MIAGTSGYRRKLIEIIGPEPAKNAVLCDMCMRWEVGDGRHDRPDLCLRARVGLWIASALILLAAHVTGWSGLAQARYLARTGRAIDDQRTQ